jgi:hypothetical protein
LVGRLNNFISFLLVCFVLRSCYHLVTLVMFTMQ